MQDQDFRVYIFPSEFSEQLLCIEYNGGMMIMIMIVIGAVTLAIYPWVNGCCPRGSNFLCATDFPRVKLPSGNFHGYVKKNKRISHGSSRGNFYGLIRTQSGSTNHEKVKCTKH